MIKLGSIIPGSRDFSPIGLEIGTNSIRMAQLRKTANGWAVSDVRMKQITESDDENGRTRKDTIIQAIKDCMKESSFSGRSVVSVMPGYQLDILPVKLSLSEDERLEDAIVEEARAHLSYDIEDAVIDYIPIENSGSETEKGRTERSLLTAARREDVDEHLSILKGAKLKPVALDISACAISRIIGSSCNDKEENILVINAGELHTTLTLFWKDNILLDRNIIWGRENMEENLMNRLKLDRKKSGGLLNRVGLHLGENEKEGPENGSNEHINKISGVVYEIVSTQLDKLTKEIEKVLQYFSSEMRGAAINVLYLMGTVSTIRNLDAYLANSTGISTEYLNPLSIYNLEGNNVSKDNNAYGSSFGVALGLAMRGFKNQDVKPERE